MSTNTNTKKLVWRLKEQPSSESLMKLVADGLLTKDEAREMLFSSETEEDRDKKSLESEIKFLRSLVEQLSQKRVDNIIKVIEEVRIPYVRSPWYRHYDIWCNATNSNQLGTGGGMTEFSDIKTF